MRLFVAAYPSPTALDHLADEVTSLPMVAYARDHGTNVRLANAALWHVTLAFLGDVEDDRLGLAIGALDAAAASVAAPASIRIAGGGTFGRGRFTTAWAGFTGGDLEPSAVAARRALKRARLPYDRKPFRAHLTIARPGDRVPRPILDESLARLAAYAGPKWTLDEICLVSSHLGPKPWHETVHRAPIH